MKKERMPSLTNSIPRTLPKNRKSP